MADRDPQTNAVEKFITHAAVRDYILGMSDSMPGTIYIADAGDEEKIRTAAHNANVSLPENASFVCIGSVDAQKAKQAMPAP